MDITKVILWGRDENKTIKLSNDINSNNIEIKIEKANLSKIIKLIITSLQPDHL